LIRTDEDRQHTDSCAAAEVMCDDQGVEQCYVSVKVARDGRIAAVHFLGRDPRSIENLRSLVGMPESTLNLLYNFGEAKRCGKPFDVLAYLAAPWARAVFHDQYGGLVKRITELLQQHGEVQQLRHEMLGRVKRNNELSLRDEDREEALSRLTANGGNVRLLVEKEIIRYLHEHKSFLPQHYCLPNMSAHVAVAPSL
jgi:hypothetical protein